MQRLRFINFCVNSFKKKLIDLRSNGLGLESSKALAHIIKKNTHYCKLNLSSNQIGDNGAIIIGKALKENNNFIHLDLSSNEITAEGSAILIKYIQQCQGLISLNLHSNDSLKKNRLGIKGAEALGELLVTNFVISYINISSVGIGKEGLEFIIKGIAVNQSLLYINLADNGFDSKSINSLCASINISKLTEIVIRENLIGNKGCEYISNMFMGTYQGVCNLIKIDMAKCGITEDGCIKLFTSLENNATLKELNFEGNSIGLKSGH